MSDDALNLLRQHKDDYGSEYDEHLFEQYKICVEMADRVSARRMLANSFFAGVHTTLAIAFTVLLKEKVLQSSLLIFVPLVALLLLCYLWWSVVNSYRQLNSGKYKVVLALEQMLPVAPYHAEWIALGEGKDRKLYRPLTYEEKWVPVCFGVLYLLLTLIFYFKG
ncbi:MAG: hypothetical protein OXK78_15800 [Caldilineaceae bacterium]|nr:hypothetical protein [Caldilineaceae bacterium]